MKAVAFICLIIVASYAIADCLAHVILDWFMEGE